MTAEVVELEPAPTDGASAAASSSRGRSADEPEAGPNDTRLTLVERLGLLAVVALAAVTRFVGLSSRGRFDADQGHDMLVLLGMTHGTLPLLGPRTSVGEFHHGAFYYYLLSPAALVSGADPVVVTAWIAILGIAAVALTWWLARAIGGPLAGLVAGLLLAVSPAGIEQSTFIWNPNPIPLFAALSLTAAWRGHVSGRARWWAISLGAAAAVVQLHVLGVVFLVGVVAILVAEAWRAAPEARIALGRGALGGIALAALLFLPLAIHELQSGFLETRRIAEYLASEGAADGGNPPATLFFTLLRVIAWPISGLVTDAPALAAIVVAVTVGLMAWRLVAARGRERTATWWLAGLLGWSVLALALAAPSLQRVVPGLPNDHYHAFADPIVCILLGLGTAALFRLARGSTRLAGTDQVGTGLRPGVLIVAVGLVALLALEIVRWPRPDPDGGWPAARDAGARIAAAAGGGTVLLLGLPDFKLVDGIGFPVVHAGAALAAIDHPADVVVVACDRLFEGAIGAPCGLAEDLLVRDLVAPDGTLPYDVSRFDASPRTAISIYTPR
jgi:4-amino-4-deoxy-L-arabinose transferase-like glycosyltransferase